MSRRTNELDASNGPIVMGLRSCMSTIPPLPTLGMALVLPSELHLVFHVFHPLHPARDFNGFFHDEYGAYCAFQPDPALVGFDANPFVLERGFSINCLFHPGCNGAINVFIHMEVLVYPTSSPAPVSCPVIVEQLGSSAIRMANKNTTRLLNMLSKASVTPPFIP